MTISGPTLSPLSSFHLTWEASQLGNVFDRQQRQYTPLPLISARSRHEIGSLHLRSLQKLGVAHIRRAHTFAFDRRDHFGIALVDALVDRREVHAHGRTGGRGGSRCAQHVPMSDCERADGEKSEKHRKGLARARGSSARSRCPTDEIGVYCVHVPERACLYFRSLSICPTISMAHVLERNS